MMSDTLRYDNEHGLVRKCVKKQGQNKAWRDQGDQKSLLRDYVRILNTLDIASSH